MIAAKASAARKPAPKAIPIVEVSEVKLQDIQLLVESQGTVKPKQQINLVSEVAGSVIWISPALVNGGRVSQGDLLLKIDPIAYELAVAEAKSALAQSQLNLADEQAEYKRATAYGLENKFNTQSLRKHKLATVEAEHEASKARLKKAQHELSKTQILAPFDGLISAKAVDIGQYVSVGNTLFNLMGTAVAEILLPINASELRFLSEPQQSQVILKSSVGYGSKQTQQQWQAELVRVEGFVDEQTRVINTVAELHKPYDSDFENLPMGTFVEADIVGQTVNQAVRIPTSALHGDKVYVVADGRLMAKSVHVYRQEKQQVVIDKGLTDKDQIVLTRLDLMIEGMQVEPRLITGAEL